VTPNEERSEDLAWIAKWYGTPREAARRLGISLGALEHWCRRHDPDVLEQLRANEARRRGCVA
jgi:transposase